MKNLVVVVMLLSHLAMLGQETVATSNLSEVLSRKGQLFVTWGYNRAYYNKSDVHFKGDGFDFTLKDVQATDMPERFGKVYIDPKQISVPQFNFRAGYYINENTALSFGWDHMKYRFIPVQQVTIDGYIDSTLAPGYPQYTGTFQNDKLLYTGEFMDYHHSDGFNIIRAAIEQRVPFWHSKEGNQVLAFNGAASLGAMLPWTNFTLFGNQYLNKLHLSGYGVSVSLGVRYEFMKWFFVQANAQYGWSNLTNIMLQDERPSRASQKIVFFERSLSIGGYIPVKRHK